MSFILSGPNRIVSYVHMRRFIVLIISPFLANKGRSRFIVSDRGIATLAVGQLFVRRQGGIPTSNVDKIPNVGTARAQCTVQRIPLRLSRACQGFRWVGRVNKER